MADSQRYERGSTNYLWVRKVTDGDSNLPTKDLPSSAFVTKIFDLDGLTVLAGAGTAIPISFAYVPGRNPAQQTDYRAALPPDLPVLPAKYYPVTVVISGAGWQRTLTTDLFIL